jgi:osmotically-inducible protein OsmY
MIAMYKNGFYFILLCILLAGCSSVISTVRSTPIQDDPHTRSIGSAIDDNIIETKAKVNLSEASPFFDQANIVVVSYNGVVLLAGQVPNEELKQTASDALKPIVKVRSIHNELTSGPNISIFARSYDTWLTAKMNTRLTFTGGITSGNVKVVTENKVMYLMGLVTESEAETITNAATEVDGLERIVKIFEYINP